MLVIPLIVSALALGVAGLGDLRSARAHRAARRSPTRSSVSAIAVLHRRRPGEPAAPRRGALARAARRGSPRRPRAAPAAAPRPPAPAASTSSSRLVPDNIVKAMADGDMLAVMVFALFLGIGLALTPHARPRAPFERGARRASTTSTMRLLGLVIRLAPVGVACLLFTLTARLGYDVLRQLGAYVLVVLLALAIHQFVVYSLVGRAGSAA